MKKQSRREQVLARSRAADAARFEALRESDGAAVYTPDEDEQEMEEVEQTDEITSEEHPADEGGK